MAAKKPQKPLSPREKLEKTGIEAICEQIADGVYYSDIAESVEVARGTLIKWLEDNHSDLYARAREARADKLAEDMLEIADSDSTYIDEKGIERIDSGAVQRDRLRVDSRKWLASKMFPKKYGDKLTSEITGKDGAPLIPEQSENDKARRVAFLLAKAMRAKNETEPSD